MTANDAESFELCIHFHNIPYIKKSQNYFLVIFYFPFAVFSFSPLFPLVIALKNKFSRAILLYNVGENKGRGYAYLVREKHLKFHCNGVCIYRYPLTVVDKIISISSSYILMQPNSSYVCMWFLEHLAYV